MEIVWDKEADVIRMGKAEFKGYCNWRGWKPWAVQVAMDNGAIKHVHGHPKDVNTFLADTLKGRPSVLYKHFNKLQYKAFVAPYLHLVSKVGYGSRVGINPLILHQVRKNKDILQQAYDDKLYNLLPIIAFTGKSPQELKRLYKGGWKVIANNSLSKNRALAKVLRKGVEAEGLVDFLHLPTTVLKVFTVHAEYYGREAASVMSFIANNFKGKWSKPALIREDIVTYADTMGLANRLGEKVNPKWSARRVKEEHDRMVKAINAQKYSPEPFACLANITPKRFEHEGFVATLLMSAKEIAEEGTDMGHCVGLYANNVREGTYLVYSVTKDGERTSTIGLYRQKALRLVPGADRAGYVFPETTVETDDTDMYSFNQHYAKYNRAVEDEREREIPTLLIHQLNQGRILLDGTLLPEAA